MPKLIFPLVLFLSLHSRFVEKHIFDNLVRRVHGGRFSMYRYIQIYFIIGAIIRAVYSRLNFFSFFRNIDPFSFSIHCYLKKIFWCRSGSYPFACHLSIPLQPFPHHGKLYDLTSGFHTGLSRCLYHSLTLLGIQWGLFYRRCVIL